MSQGCAIAESGNNGVHTRAAAEFEYGIGQHGRVLMKLLLEPYQKRQSKSVRANLVTKVPGEVGDTTTESFE